MIVPEIREREESSISIGASVVNGLDQPDRRGLKGTKTLLKHGARVVNGLPTFQPAHTRSTSTMGGTMGGTIGGTA